MEPIDRKELLFERLFRETYVKYFHRNFDTPLTETESKLLCIDIEEKTGLALGFKSLKNYSIYFLGSSSRKKENPSLFTLDTLSRYVLNAPLITEQERKQNESHYPYWHLYQKKANAPLRRFRSKKMRVALITTIPFGILAAVVLRFVAPSTTYDVFTDEFVDNSDDALAKRSWTVLNKSSFHWNKRLESDNALRLYTLDGDNWPGAGQKPTIANLMVRPVDLDCFETEVLLRGFVPGERWQQAGIILLQDTIFSGPTLRLSLAFNDYFGGFDLSPEIIVQGILSNGTDKPEEILHHQVFQLRDTPNTLVGQNLNYCGLKIEKKGNTYRFLLSSGAMENAAYQEIGKREIDFSPNFIGLFALKGHEEPSGIVPVEMERFVLEGDNCPK